MLISPGLQDSVCFAVQLVWLDSRQRCVDILSITLLRATAHDELGMCKSGFTMRPFCASGLGA